MSAKKHDVDIVMKGGQHAIEHIKAHKKLALSFEDKYTPLISVAVSCGHDELFDVMCDIAHECGYYPFYLVAATAVASNRYNMLEKLITRYGVDVNTPYRIEYYLHLAAMYDSRNDVLQLLLSHKADTNVFNNSLETPLCVATYYNAFKNVQSLLASGANTLGNKNYTISESDAICGSCHGNNIKSRPDIVKMLKQNNISGNYEK